MKKLLLSILSLFSLQIALNAQNTTLEIHSNGFKPEDKVSIKFHDGGSYKIDPSTEVQTIQMDINEPKRGIIFIRKPNRLFFKSRWKEIYIDPGKNVVKLERRRFRRKTSLTGSSSNTMFQTYLKGSKKDRLSIQKENPNHPFFNSCKN